MSNSSCRDMSAVISSVADIDWSSLTHECTIWEGRKRRRQKKKSSSKGKENNRTTEQQNNRTRYTTPTDLLISEQNHRACQQNDLNLPLNQEYIMLIHQQLQHQV